jgi:hypothetical protein
VNLRFPKKNTVFAIFLILFILLINQRFVIEKHFAPYIFQEWIINYSQGFIRRGLFGSILLSLHSSYGVDIFTFIKDFSYTTFLLLAGIYILKVRRSQDILNRESLTVLLFLPSLILFPLYDPNVIGRKEVFFFFGLVINLFLLQKATKNLVIGKYAFKILGDSGLKSSFGNPKSPFLKRNTLFQPQILNKSKFQINHFNQVYNVEKLVNSYCLNLFIWFNLLSIPVALSHEGILFLALPLNMIISANLISLIFPIRQTLWRTFLIYSPTVLVAIICLYFSGNKEIAIGICESWQTYSQAYKSLYSDCAVRLPAILNYYAYSTKEVLRIVVFTNILKGKGIIFFCWIFAFILNLLILFRTSSSVISKSVDKLNQQNYESAPEPFHQNDSKQLEPIYLNHIDIITSFSFKYAVIPLFASLIVYLFALDWGRWFFVICLSYVICFLTPGLIQLEIVGLERNKWMLELWSPIYLSYSKLISFFFNQTAKAKFSIFYSTLYSLVFIYTIFVLRIDHFQMSIEYLFKGFTDLIEWIYPILN